MNFRRIVLSIGVSLGALSGWSDLHAQSAAPATIVVTLPADAVVVVGGAKTTQTGPSRTFYTPDLVPGFRYQYEFKVTWRDAGREETKAEWIDVQPGKTVTLKFGGTFVTKKDDEPKKTTKVETKTEAPKSRSFLFVYSGTVKDLKPGEEASVWLPVPKTTSLQKVEIVKQDVPGSAKIGEEKQYGNKMLHFKAKANDKGEVPFSVTYKVERTEALTSGKGTLTVKEDSSLVNRFLEPDKLVPTSGKPLELIKDKKLPADKFQAAKEMYDIVNDHMKYDKPVGKPWGRGDAVWACDSKFGNCTDFHSLFISMARGNKIPSKFEMGFSIPLKHGKGDIGGYHCWAWFLPEGKGWIPIDISEANRFPEMKAYYFGNLTEDRVQFSTGRDIDLVPQQKGPALNFFIYPYVEVNGMTYPAEKVARKFAYEDVK